MFVDNITSVELVLWVYMDGVPTLNFFDVPASMSNGENQNVGIILDAEYDITFEL